MKLHTVRVEGSDGWVYWILFWQGQIHAPVAILDDLVLKRLVKSCQEQMRDAQEAMSQAVTLTDGDGI